MRSVLPFVVLAACIDSRSGKRFAVGDEFDPVPTYDQAKRLVAAGCLPHAALDAVDRLEQSGGVDRAAISRDQINHDGLFNLSVEELQDIAAQEGIAVDQEGIKAAVIASIRESRANKPAAVDSQNLEMRTEAGERAARVADQTATNAQIDQAEKDATRAAEQKVADDTAKAAAGTTDQAAVTTATVDAVTDAPLEARTAGDVSDRYADTKPAKATTKAK